MKKEVAIRIIGRQLRDGTWEEAITETRGKYYKDEGIIYLFYEEADEGAGVCKTRITLRERGMQVNRQGAITTTLLYEMGIRNNAVYRTPLGALEIGTEATHYIVAEKEDELTVDLGYKLFLNADEHQEATLRISAKEI